MNTKPNNENLLNLVKQAQTGKIVLPQFQRSFVWTKDGIADLLVSILEGYFIGTFLMLDTDADSVPFGMRAIEGSDLVEKELHPEWMILDGQQRLTSLHYVFAAPKIPLRWGKHPYRFFLDLNKVVEGKLDDAVIGERASYMEAYLDRQRQYETLIVPFTELADWDSWRDGYDDWLYQDRDAYEVYRQHYRPAWNKMMKHLENFEVPVIEIPKIDPENQDAVELVCAIFEKMNSTGVPLSVYDLLTAKLYRYGIKLRTLWDDTVNNGHELIKKVSEGEPDVYGIFILRIIALLRGMTDIRSRELIKLEAANFAEDWAKAAKYLEQALERLTSTSEGGFGAFDAKWFPYPTMLPTLAAALAKIAEKKLGHEAYDVLRRWYWASVFTERYNASVEGKMYKDYADLLIAFGIAKPDRQHLIEPAFEPDAIKEARRQIIESTNYTLRNVSRVNSVYRGVMCLTALVGARDFRTGDSIEFHLLDDHHIFPKSYLEKQKNEDGKKRYSADQINCIINRTLISRDTNLKISKSAPSAYVDKLVPGQYADAIMDSHYINAPTLEAMCSDNFEGFTNHREQALMNEIRRQITGE